MAPSQDHRVAVSDDGTTLLLTSYEGRQKLAEIPITPTHAVALAIRLLTFALTKLPPSP